MCTFFQKTKKDVKLNPLSLCIYSTIGIGLNSVSRAQPAYVTSMRKIEVSVILNVAIPPVDKEKLLTLLTIRI